VAERTLIITSSPPHWHDLAEVTCARMKAYADKWDYDFYADVSDLRDRLPSGQLVGIKGFVKLDLFLHFLPKYQRVVWLDSDLIITNPDISLDELTFFSPKPLIIGYDHNGHNTTFISARSSELMVQFMWAANNTGRKLFLGHDWVEMEAMRYFLMTPPYQDIVTYISCKRLCPILATEYVDAGLPLSVSGVYSWEPGDFALHLSALPIERRTELAKAFAIQCPV
jgi:hypothetical protein